MPETMQPNIFTTHVIPDEDNKSLQPKDPIEQVDSHTEERLDISGKPDDPVTQGQPHTTMVDL